MQVGSRSITGGMPGSCRMHKGWIQVERQILFLCFGGSDGGVGHAAGETANVVL
jgi:hypothetical protein